MSHPPGRGAKSGYVFLHSAIDGYSRLGYTRLGYNEALDDEKAVTAVAFLNRARAWFAAHGMTQIERIVADNGACYRASGFADAIGESRHQRITPHPPRHNGRIERYNRILAEEFRYARTWTSEPERAAAIQVGTVTTTITDPTARTMASHRHPRPPNESPTSWLHPASRPARRAG